MMYQLKTYNFVLQFQKQTFLHRTLAFYYRMVLETKDLNVLIYIISVFEM